MMTYRLLVLDLDGTVMTSELTISPAVIAAIAEAQERGTTVAVATGRVYTSARQILQRLGISTPVIAFQGAVVRDPVSGQVIYSASIPANQAVDVTTRLREMGIYTLGFHGDNTIVDDWTPELDLYLSFHPGGEKEIVRVPDLIEFLRRNDPIKLQFVAAPDELDQLIADLSDEFEQGVSVMRSHHNFGEVTAPSVHKGTALERLANHLGIPQREVMAIGDRENDLQMIEWAGLGLAMANAPQAVIEAADAVVPSILDDGVAWAIEHYLLDGKVR